MHLFHNKNICVFACLFLFHIYWSDAWDVASLVYFSSLMFSLFLSWHPALQSNSTTESPKSIMLPYVSRHRNEERGHLNVNQQIKLLEILIFQIPDSSPHETHLCPADSWLLWNKSFCYFSNKISFEVGLIWMDLFFKIKEIWAKWFLYGGSFGGVVVPMS